MATHFAKCMFAGLLTVAAFGCEPRPVVVDPDDDGTTIIEEGDVEVERTEPAIPPPESDSGVEVDVGGGEGVDIKVNRDDDATPNR
jgi:hypothetical protein